MEKSTIEHIKLLTGLDTKSLSERVLKLFEEGGELARAVLPYDNVSSTRHRFVEKERILEETIDCLLVAYSIAYHMDFTEDEIDDMFKQKLMKWNKILTRKKKHEVNQYLMRFMLLFRYQQQQFLHLQERVKI